MGNPSFSIRFALVLSISFAASYATASYSRSLSSLKPHASSSNECTSPKASASDLLSLLGTQQQASAINAEEARELSSCLKFLVPFSPIQLGSKSGTRRELSSTPIASWSRSEEDGLVWWPPAPVMELARLSVNSGGDPAAIHLAFDPTVIPVPDVEGSKEDRCVITRTPYGRRFINDEVNSYFKFLFEIIAARGPSVGLNVSLNRYDLFHGHLFLASDSGRLGILFHARDFPAYDKEVFPYNMGYCQIGSNVTYDDSMNLRNILWLAPLPSNSTKDWLAPGVLVVLDAHPGGIIYRDLVPEYATIARTIYEEDFGALVADVNYLNVGDAVADYQIFIC